MQFLKTISLCMIFLLSSLANCGAEGTEYFAVVTAYTSSVEECGKDDGVTASGVIAQEGITVASDDLPLGTRVEINGAMYVVQDRFGGNYRNRVDIYMTDVSRAIQFGRQRIVIRILEEW